MPRKHPLGGCRWRGVSHRRLSAALGGHSRPQAAFGVLGAEPHSWHPPQLALGIHFLILAGCGVEGCTRRCWWGAEGGAG